MTRLRSLILFALAVTPVLCGTVLVQFAEPFPDGWLTPGNPHYWANMLRAVAFMLGGSVLGMIAYTMAKSIKAETTVTGGHPRVKLYNHVTMIAFGHGMLMVTMLFYIRDRINQPLSPATPLGLVGLVTTVVALAYMLSYQNSRLHANHRAKQVLATIARGEGDDDGYLCIHVVGSTESMHLDDWIDSIDTGELLRLTVEKVEEVGEGEFNFVPRRRKRDERPA